MTDTPLCKCHDVPMKKSGHSWRCYVKYNEYQKKWHKQNPDYNRKWEAQNRKGRNVGQWHNRKYRYGLSEETYLTMLVLQDSQCGICEIDFKNRDKICVDHDHMTGKVRKLLCHHCNVGLGNFRDSILKLRKAASYDEDGSNQQEVMEIR